MSYITTRANGKILFYLTIIPRARVGYEMVCASLAIIISYATSESGIIVLLISFSEVVLDVYK